MNVNVIFEIGYHKNKLFVQTIRLNEKGSTHYEFHHEDKPIEQHSVVFANPAKLPRRSQTAYRTLRGDEIALYFDLVAFQFIFRGTPLVPVESLPDRPKDSVYQLTVRPASYLQSLETKAFLALPASERAERLFNLIPKTNQEQFLHIPPFGYEAVREQFLAYFTEAYT